MFPVYTGINRLRREKNSYNIGVPCIHRDKPRGELGQYDGEAVFPVYTGINRSMDLLIRLQVSVPCIHRDKPQNNVAYFYLLLCSLYTQG